MSADLSKAEGYDMKTSTVKIGGVDVSLSGLVGTRLGSVEDEEYAVLFDGDDYPILLPASRVVFWGAPRRVKAL